MTWKQLASAILELHTEQLDKDAEVFPPLPCPATSRVKIEQLLTEGDPLLSTGKIPDGHEVPANPVTVSAPIGAEKARTEPVKGEG